MVKLVNQYAEDAVNFVLRNIPEPIPILSGIQLNLTLLELPAITKDISHQIFDGTFLYRNEPIIDPNYDQHEIPEYFP